jgi:hypothetical protein
VCFHATRSGSVSCISVTQLRCGSCPYVGQSPSAAGAPAGRKKANAIDASKLDDHARFCHNALEEIRNPNDRNGREASILLAYAT